MDRELMLDVDQANEIKLAARRAGATNADLKKLSEGGMFARILPVLRGMADVASAIIDCDADPLVLEGYKVEEHIKGGQFEWDPAKVELYLSEEQKSEVVEGNILREELKKKTVLNANVLDYLIDHPHLIPEEWRKGNIVFFWGTTYCYSADQLLVRCLVWGSDGWRKGYRWLNQNWDSDSPAAVLAN